jgi:protein-disulfide isomerase
MNNGGRMGIAAGVGLLAGGVAVALATGSLAAGAGPKDRAAIETIVREYILAHPEIIPEAMKSLQQKETGKLVADNRKAIETPFAGAWAGAKDGDVTLVMFTDYACPYCRTSAPDVDRLLASDKRLKVVWRELPILGPPSEEAARAGLSAAKQGRYLAFHRNMFAAGRPEPGNIAKARTVSGLDPARTAADANAPDIAREIQANIALARALGLTGTPTFVVGDRLLMGAVGYDELVNAIAEARKKG